MVEGASIDKQAHESDADRTIWDTIEFDNAVQVALDFARRTNGDADPANDTLVVVTADHESGGFGIIGVGNERYAPAAFGRAVRDYAAIFRFQPAQTLNLFTNYTVDARASPPTPIPRASCCSASPPAPTATRTGCRTALRRTSVAHPGERPRSGRARRRQRAFRSPTRGATGRRGQRQHDRRRQAVPGVPRRRRRSRTAPRLSRPAGCPDDTRARPRDRRAHGERRAALGDGPGALQFTGVYENTDVFVKILRSTMGSYPPGVPRRR